MKLDRRAIIRAKILARCVRVGNCLIWQGPDSGKTGRGRGYPRMNLDGGTVAVHRAWFINENGPIPPRKQLGHTCVHRMCISCTELVTHKKNQKDRAKSNVAARASKGEPRNIRRNPTKNRRRKPTRQDHSRPKSASGPQHERNSFGNGPE